MVRTSNNSNNNSGGPEDAALQVASSVLSKQSQYTDDLSRQFHPRACDLAGRLHDDTGELAQALLSYAADVDETQNRGDDAHLSTKMAAFLDEQRSRLKRHVVANAKRARDVEAFCGAVGAVRDDIRMKRQAAATAQLDSDGVDDATATNGILAKFDAKSGDGVDYERTILDQMKERTGGDGDGDDGDDEEDLQRFQSNAMVRDILERLGEKVQGGAKTTGEDDDDDDDDDDLEMVGDASGNNHGADLRCPITTTYFDQPLKNTKCGHVYSKQGIEQHLRGHGRKQRKCPVAGCTNDDVQKSQLVEDVEMAMRVKRFKKKEERQKRAKMSQLDDLDDE